jgi:hypothetical protein
VRRRGIRPGFQTEQLEQIPDRFVCPGTEEGMEADDRLCSRNARSQKALGGRAQWKIDPLPSLKRERASWQDTPLSSRFHPGQVKFKGSRGNKRAGVVLLSLPLHIVGGTAWLLEPVSRLCGFLSSRQGTQVALSAAVERGPSKGARVLGALDPRGCPAHPFHRARVASTKGPWPLPSRSCFERFCEAFAWAVH